LLTFQPLSQRPHRGVCFGIGVTGELLGDLLFQSGFVGFRGLLFCHALLFDV
jgi:hypothetical protein